MNNCTLSDTHGNTYTRISKQRAIKRHLSGHNVYILPRLAYSPSAMYPEPHCIPRELDTLHSLTAFLRAYTWSNCNDELGYYISYYIKEGE